METPVQEDLDTLPPTDRKKMEVQASLTVLSVLYEMNRTRSKLLHQVEQIFLERKFFTERDLSFLMEELLRCKVGNSKFATLRANISPWSPSYPGFTLPTLGAPH